jgi:hypothetical protein
VVRAEVFLVDDQRARRRDQHAVDLDADLPLREDGELALELLARPRLDRERLALDLLDRAQIRLAELANDEPRPGVRHPPTVPPAARRAARRARRILPS